MSGKRILVVVGDRGGYNALAPVLRLAIEHSCSVSVHLSATCARQFEAGGLLLPSNAQILCDPTGQSVVDYTRSNPHDLLVIGASQSEEGSSVAAQAALATNAPVLAMEDLYGSLRPTLQHIQGADVNPKQPVKMTVCAATPFAYNLLNDYPWNESGIWLRQLTLTGGPQFDRIPDMRQSWDTTRRSLRERLVVRDDDPVFLVCGQLHGTAEILALIKEAYTLLRDANVGRVRSPRIILRPHPRGTPLDKAMTRLFRQIMQPAWFLADETIDRLASTSEDFLPAADFVLSGYSTTSHFAVLCDMPGVVYVGTPSFWWDHQHEKGLQLPPEVTDDMAWYVEAAVELMTVIDEVGRGSESPRLEEIHAARQPLLELNDGNAAKRVWEEMQELLELQT